MSETTDVINEFLESIKLSGDYRTSSLDLLEQGESRYLRDLKVNFNSTLTSEHLSGKEIGLLGVTIAANNQNKPLLDYFSNFSQENGATKEDVAEAVACASLLAS